MYRQTNVHVVVCGGGILCGGYWGGGGGWLIWWSLARLSEEVNTCAIFPLGPLHTDLVRRHRGSLYSAVGGAHQSDSNPTIDVPVRLQVGFLPLGGQATG